MKIFKLAMCCILFCTYSYLVSATTFDKGWVVSPYRSIIMPPHTSSDNALLSSAGYDDSHWKYHHISIPSTAMNVVIQSHANPNNYEKQIFSEMNLSKVDVQQFRQPWFYRKTFTLNKTNSDYILHLEGINYLAQLWVNGKKVNNRKLHDQIINPFIQYSFDIKDYLKEGENVILLEIVPPFCFHYKQCNQLSFARKGDYTGDFNIGFVDWSPEAPDFEMGITRPVILSEYKDTVSIDHSFAITRLSNDNQIANLTLQTNIKNMAEKNIHYKVTALLDGKSVATTQVLLRSQELKALTFSPKKYPQLIIHHPTLWWPYQYGTPRMHKLVFTVQNDKNRVVAQSSTDIGIREVKTYNDSYVSNNQNKYAREFEINGKRITIQGSEWLDAEFLNETHQKIKQELLYVKQMGLNTIRLEGFWGHDAYLYDEADKLGIFILPGWSCQWEWSYYLDGWTKITPNVVNHCDPLHGCIQTKDDINLISEAFNSQVLWLRNHPSIIAWMTGSDTSPNKSLSEYYDAILKKNDPTRTEIISAGETGNKTAESSGLKMRGPYAYEPPIYWFENTDLGGAFGFASEINPGAELPSSMSIKEMLPITYLDWWRQKSNTWDFHAGRGHFYSLNRFYNPAIENRLGKPRTFDEYQEEAQLTSYEAMRAMFEAYLAYQNGNPHKKNVPATGVIQWQLTSSWPETYWQLFDYYLRPTAAFYGAQEANKKVHAIYDPSTNHIYVNNKGRDDAKSIDSEVTVYDINSNVLYKKTVFIPQLNASSSALLPNLVLPTFKSFHFLNIKLLNNKNVLDENMYWLAAEQSSDVLDYKHSEWFYTPIKQYANLHYLRKMPFANILSQCTMLDATHFRIKAINQDQQHIALFIHFTFKGDNNADNTAELWNDNNISLAPGENRTLTLHVQANQKTSSIVVSGWNSLKQTVKCSL